MTRIGTAVLTLSAFAVSLAGCGDTDVQNRGGEIAPGQEVEDMGLERDVEPVDLDTLSWVMEGGTVTFNNRTWIMAGPPVFDPAVTYVGEFQGTPLYAEVGTSPPYNQLFIPLEGDNWQLLEETGAPPPDTSANTGMSEIR